MLFTMPGHSKDICICVNIILLYYHGNVKLVHLDNKYYSYIFTYFWYIVKDT